MLNKVHRRKLFYWVIILEIIVFCTVAILIIQKASNII